jgi:hypothetical protein
MPFTDCKIWKGKIGKTGYGWARSKYVNNTRNAHRVVWEEINGPLPKGMCIMHLCDNRSCVNLEHLKLGTPKENKQDMIQKNRWCDRSGEKHPLNKVTLKEVKQIKKLYKKGINQIELAKKFFLNQSTISRFINDKRWQKYVPVY